MSKHGWQTLNNETNISVLFAAKINEVKVGLWEKKKRGEKYIRQLASAYLRVYVYMRACQKVSQISFHTDESFISEKC